MKFTSAATLAAIAVGVSAQGAAIGIAPQGGSPAGCLTTADGFYELTVVQTAADAAANKPAKRDVVEKRQQACAGPDALVFSIKNGVLTDTKGRIGAIVANRQFQFDGPPPQTGSVYTGGFSICQNSSLAIGPTTNFYQCRSGGFYNLYDQPSESACMVVKFNTIRCTPVDGAAAGSGSGSAVQSQADGQPTASSAAIVSQQSDGQPTASIAGIVSQQSDGQPTASAAGIVSQQSDGQPTASSAPAIVTQLSDGQPQATAASNATVTSARPSTVPTGAAAQLIGSGAIAIVGAAAALFL